MKSMPHLHVSYGDIVLAIFDKLYHHKPERQTRRVRVTEVKYRYGACNNGTTPINPLVAGVNTVTGEEEYFDISYVRQVLERYTGPRPTPRNRFKERRGSVLWVKEGSKYGGPLESIATYSLGKLSLELLRTLDVDRLHELYMRDKLGLKKILVNDGTSLVLVVDAKRFDKWIRRNVYAILETSQELHDQATHFHTRTEEIYEKDVEHDMMTGDL